MCSCDTRNSETGAFYVKLSSSSEFVPDMVSPLQMFLQNVPTTIITETTNYMVCLLLLLIANNVTVTGF